ncbi:MAG: hypothetical protein K5864_07895 [Bacteroidales bacterium]|nr:hypothetical protein [Bacteroidales bacterium]
MSRQRDNRNRGARGERRNDNEQGATPTLDEEQLQPQPAEMQPAEPDEDAATAEDVAAFLRERREQRQANQSAHKERSESEQEEPIDYASTENAMDPYLEPDPTLPFVKYQETPFLAHGCSHCPTSYVPVEERETRSCAKVCSHNWMKGIRRPAESLFDCVEVRFKNNRKDFYRLPDGIDVQEGDVVAVEGMPGHDVGIVTLTGEVCRIQMQKKKVNPDSENIKKLFRRAKASDIERWATAIKEEDNALKKTRQITEELGLVMKVNDVEYQGDHSKAIFYYTADDRVDFRVLIKVLAEQFKVRIEMKQIGVRQESGKVGGIGTCGRELCCCTWLTNFKSVTTGVAKAQQILPNPQKLAGQCGKLKCCLNFEYEVYVDALKKFPPANTPIRFQKGLALYRKTDVFRGIMWYAYEGESDLIAVKAEDVKAIIEMNKAQQYPEKLEDYQVELMSTAALAQESSADEFERELRRMADDNFGGGSEEHEKRGEREERGSRNEGRGRRDNREPREPRENREPREPRENREPRGEGRENRNNGPRNERRGKNGAGRGGRNRREGGEGKPRNNGENHNIPQA